MKKIIAYFFSIVISRLFIDPWWEIKWEWSHRWEKNNRAKRKRKARDRAHVLHVAQLKREGRL